MHLITQDLFQLLRAEELAKDGTLILRIFISSLDLATTVVTQMMSHGLGATTPRVNLQDGNCVQDVTPFMGVGAVSLLGLLVQLTVEEELKSGQDHAIIQHQLTGEVTVQDHRQRAAPAIPIPALLMGVGVVSLLGLLVQLSVEEELKSGQDHAIIQHQLTGEVTVQDHRQRAAPAIPIPALLMGVGLITPPGLLVQLSVEEEELKSGQDPAIIQHQLTGEVTVQNHRQRQAPAIPIPALLMGVGVISLFGLLVQLTVEEELKSGQDHATIYHQLTGEVTVQDHRQRAEPAIPIPALLMGVGVISLLGLLVQLTVEEELKSGQDHAIIQHQLTGEVTVQDHRQRAAPAIPIPALS